MCEAADRRCDGLKKKWSWKNDSDFSQERFSAYSCHTMCVVPTYYGSKPPGKLLRPLTITYKPCELQGCRPLEANGSLLWNDYEFLLYSQASTLLKKTLNTVSSLLLSALECYAETTPVWLNVECNSGAMKRHYRVRMTTGHFQLWWWTVGGGTLIICSLSHLTWHPQCSLWALESSTRGTMLHSSSIQGSLFGFSVNPLSQPTPEIWRIVHSQIHIGDRKNNKSEILLVMQLF